VFVLVDGVEPGVGTKIEWRGWARTRARAIAAGLARLALSFDDRLPERYCINGVEVKGP
jgi:hypothetical protein